MTVALYKYTLAALLLVPAFAGRSARPATDVVVITGKVVAANGAPIASAIVGVQSRGAVVQTSATGVYTLRLSGDTLRGRTVRLTTRALGYAAAMRDVKLDSDTVRVDFALQVTAFGLEEVIVTGGRADNKRITLGSAAADSDGLRRSARREREARVVVRGSTALAGPAPVQSVASANAMRQDLSAESYDRIVDNAFRSAVSAPLSTFAIDVDRASYGNVRRYVTSGQLPPKDAVRIEELVNYFPYDYPDPHGADPVSITTEVAAAPWAPKHRLVRIGLKSRHIETRNLPPSNLVFLLDVSGSMAQPNKLPLVKASLRLLVEQLREDDHVAMVVYAGSAGLVLPSTPGSDRTRILSALDNLEAGGSTAGGAGIQLAYQIARQHHLAEGNNRVILATDGDFNVGMSSDGELERLIEEKRKQGTFLTVLGYGMGNIKDSRLEKLADKGNGNYAYIDDLAEARKTLVQEMGGTLLTVAKDVKLQVEFNPARVAAYRLVGYENRLLATEDFDDDAKDAGEIGAGHSVTALYEIIPVGVKSDSRVRETPPLLFQAPPRSIASERSELMHVKLRYKSRDGDVSKLMQAVVRENQRTPSVDFRFASAVAGFGMVLRDSEYKGSATLDGMIDLAAESLGDDRLGYRAGFVDLVRRARDLQRMVSVER